VVIASERRQLATILATALRPNELALLAYHVKQKTPFLCGPESYQFATPDGRYSIEVLATTLEPFYIEEFDHCHPWPEVFVRLCRCSHRLSTPLHRQDNPDESLTNPLCEYMELMRIATPRDVLKSIQIASSM